MSGWREIDCTDGLNVYTTEAPSDSHRNLLWTAADRRLRMAI